MNHEEINRLIGGKANYGKGITPNPFEFQIPEWRRRRDNFVTRSLITNKIISLIEPRFVTPPETSECIEALITMTDSRKILELGTCTGFCTLHMLRAIIGKEGAKVVTVDGNSEHDREFFSQPEIAPWFEHVNGWTPEAFEHLRGRMFDLVFVDSAHDLEHCEKELNALIETGITRSGTVLLFHDCPRRQTPEHPENELGVIYQWLHEKVKQGVLRGTCLRTASQLDCEDVWGRGYDLNCSPGLGVFVRT